MFGTGSATTRPETQTPAFAGAHASAVVTYSRSLSHGRRSVRLRRQHRSIVPMNGELRSVTLRGQPSGLHRRRLLAMRRQYLAVPFGDPTFAVRVQLDVNIVGARSHWSCPPI